MLVHVLSCARDTHRMGSAVTTIDALLTELCSPFDMSRLYTARDQDIFSFIYVT